MGSGEARGKKRSPGFPPLLSRLFFPFLLSFSLSSLNHHKKRYCRFYCGRRIDDDERQISRWNGVAGAKGRWRRALANKCAAAGVPAARSSEASPVITQTLLHWADAVTDRDVDQALRRMK